MEYKVEQVIKENRMYILNDEPFSLSVPEGIDTIYVPEGTAEGYKALNPTVSDYIKNYSYSNYRVTKPEFYDDVTIIMDKNTNAPVLKVMFDNGLCANENYMTLAEAKAVTNETLPSFENNAEIEHFMEFQYFTGVDTINATFKNVENLQRVECPKTLKRLENGAFCFGSALFNQGKVSKLTYVGGLENVEFVGKNCFQWQNQLERLNFTSKLKYFDGTGQFGGIWGRTAPNSPVQCHLKSLGDLSNVNFTDSTGAYSFRNQTELEDVNLESLTTIGNGMFYTCAKIKPKLKWENITSIGTAAFTFDMSIPYYKDYLDVLDVWHYCPKIEHIPDMPKLEHIGQIAFQNRWIKTVGNMPNLTEWQGIGQFNGCNYLTSVGSMEKVTTIPQQCFGSCYNLKSIANVDNLETIGLKSFANAHNLDMHFPNVINVGNQAFAFYDDENIEKIYDYRVQPYHRTISFGKSFDEITWGTKPFENAYNTTIICNGVELTEEQYTTLGATKPNSETVENIVEEPAEK